MKLERKWMRTKPLSGPAFDKLIVGQGPSVAIVSQTPMGKLWSFKVFLPGVGREYASGACDTRKEAVERAEFAVLTWFEKATQHKMELA